MYWGLNLKIIGLTALALFTFSLGWSINGWRYDSKIVQSVKAVRTIEQKLQQQVAEERIKKDAEIKRITDKHLAVVMQLRDRPTRITSDTKDGRANTGAQLSREDATFLIGEATRADEITVALHQCYIQYEVVRKGLEK